MSDVDVIIGTLLAYHFFSLAEDALAEPDCGTVLYSACILTLLPLLYVVLHLWDDEFQDGDDAWPSLC